MIFSKFFLFGDSILPPPSPPTPSLKVTQIYLNLFTSPCHLMGVQLESNSISKNTESTTDMEPHFQRQYGLGER